MAEHPILFSGPMVKAILKGRKTQTRRVIPESLMMCLHPEDEPEKFIEWCKYGEPGDRLWVRETWKIASFMPNEAVKFEYPADGAVVEENSFSDCQRYEAWYEEISEQSSSYLESIDWEISEDGIYTWEIGKSPLPARPSIFMPRWASRLTLEITDIRVERLQDIDNNGALSEGTPDLRTMENNWDLRRCYQELWNSINAKRGYGWDVNPWVWVIEFRRIENHAKKLG